MDSCLTDTHPHAALTEHLVALAYKGERLLRSIRFERAHGEGVADERVRPRHWRPALHGQRGREVSVDLHQLTLG